MRKPAMKRKPGVDVVIALGPAPKGPRGPMMEDDGVMALGLALHGWDRVQGVPPEKMQPLHATGDDPYLDSDMTPAQSAGDFSQQLPTGGW